MSIDALLDYNVPLGYMNRLVDLWGQPCTVFVPENREYLGYENQGLDKSLATTGADYSNRYKVLSIKCHINFMPTKKVFYKYNIFPEEGQELVIAHFPSNSIVREGCYVRTATPQAVSIWGDLIFEVKHIKDDGVYKTLRRTYFLQPTSNMDLYRELDLQSIHI